MKLNLKLSKSSTLINFLKRFEAIDNSLLLEIKDNVLCAKSHTPERSVVKYSALELNEIFSEYSDVKDELKIGIMNIKKFIDSLKFFGESDFEMIIDYEKVNTDFVGTLISMRNSSLNIEQQCGALKLFTYISDDILSRITDTSKSSVDFMMVKEQQVKLSSLFKIEDYDRVTFLKDKNKIFVKGKSYELLILEDSDLKKADDCKLTVYKNHYSFIDGENTKVYINVEGSKLIFISNESDTKTIIGEASSYE